MGRGHVNSIAVAIATASSGVGWGEIFMSILLLTRFWQDSQWHVAMFTLW